MAGNVKLISRRPQLHNLDLALIARAAATKQMHAKEREQYGTEKDAKTAPVVPVPDWYKDRSRASGERAGLMRPKKKPLTAVQKLNVMCCGQEGCDWGLTCILVSIVLLGGAMALVAAFGEFSPLAYVK